MNRPIDQNTRDELASNFDHSYLVEAGAGTGKTSTLVSRVVGAIGRGIQITRIAAITFTEKAAGELIERTRIEIEKKFDSAKNVAEQARYHNAMENLERASIGTIHSFCASLLRKRPVEAGVDPNFKVIDELEKELLLQDAWAEFQSEHLNSEHETLVKLLESGVGLGKIETLARALIGRIADVINYTPPPVVPMFGYDLVKQRILLLLNEAETKINFCKNEDDYLYQHYLDLQNRREQLLEDLFNSPLILPDKLKPKSKGSQKNWKSKEIKDEFSIILQNIKKIIENYHYEHIEPFLNEAFLWLKTFIIQYQRSKQDQGLLDFDDLLVKTRDMLIKDDGFSARRYFQNAYDLIMLDEFQDTDPIQVEIALLLSEATPIAKKWEDVELRRGKLFLVGDIKQSIYRFRRADVGMYRRVKQNVKSLENRELVQNFRSAPELVGWFNACFDELFNADDKGAGQARYSKLNAPPNYQPPPDDSSKPGMWALKIKGIKLDIEKSNEEKKRSLESQTVARFLKDIKRGGWFARDKQKKEWRKIEWKDVALLFRTRAGLSYFAEALRAENIPFIAPGSGGLFDRPECRALISCLIAIDKPEDQVALVGALRSPFFGISDSEIVRAKLAGLAFDYLKPVPDNPDCEIFAEPFKILRESHQSKNKAPAHEIINDLFNETGVLVSFILDKREFEAANLNRILELAREFDNSVGESFGAFADYILNLEKNADMQEANEEDAERQCVKLMTVHGAKGLEFPLVVLADMANEFNGMKNTVVLLDKENNKINLNLGEIKSAEWKNAGDKEKTHIAAEELRLLYVACTRAGDYLVVPIPETGTPDKTFTSDAIKHIVEKWKDKTNYYNFDDAIRDAEKTPPEQAKEIQSKPTSKAIEEWRSAREKAIAAMSRPGLFLSATSVVKGKSTSQGDKNDRAMRLGSFVHSLLENADFTDATSLDAVADEAAAESGVDGEDAPLGLDMAKRAIETPLLKRAANSPKMKREFPIQIENENGELISSKLDLVFEENGKFVVVDYKTDDVENASEAESKIGGGYRDQIGIYVAALEKSGAQVSEAYVVFLRPAPPIVVPCKDRL